MINIAVSQSKSVWKLLPRWMQNFKSTGAGSFRYQANRAHFSFPATGTKRLEKESHFRTRSSLRDAPQFISLYRQEVTIDFLLRFFHEKWCQILSSR